MDIGIVVNSRIEKAIAEPGFLYRLTEFSFV